MLTSTIGWRGDITVTVRGPSGLEVVEFPNLITNAGLDLLVAGLAGTDCEIKYVALGSDDTPPAAGDSDLGDEEYRRAVTSQTAGATGVTDTVTIIPPEDATSFTIREIGWFGGASATSTPGSGVLVARVLYERTKTNLESLQIDRSDTIGRA